MIKVILTQNTRLLVTLNVKISEKITTILMDYVLRPYAKKSNDL